MTIIASHSFATTKIIWVHDAWTILLMWAQTEKLAKNDPIYHTPPNQDIATHQKKSYTFNLVAAC